MKNGFAVTPTQFRCGANISHANRLSTARIIGDGDHYQRHAVAFFAQDRFQCSEVDVALERRYQCWLQSFSNRNITSFSVLVFHIGAGRVEMRIVGHDLASIDRFTKQNAFRRAATMRE